MMHHDVMLRAFKPTANPLTIRAETESDRQFLHAAFFANDPAGDIDWSYPQLMEKLYEHSCVEVFIHSGAKKYVEYNLAANGESRCYFFDDYRRLAKSHLTSDPILIHLCEPCNFDMQIPLQTAHAFFGGEFQKIGLSAVLKLTSGERTFWTADHPEDKPDFHNAMFYLDR